MAPDQKKRARPTPKGKPQPAKRQKIEVSKKDEAPKRQVAADSLPWNEVAMPDMFEDAEGFFGLEEVDDVEVVREGNIVKFVTKAATEEEFEGFGDDKANGDKPATPKAKAKKAIVFKPSTMERAPIVKEPTVEELEAKKAKRDKKHQAIREEKAKKAKEIAEGGATKAINPKMAKEKSSEVKELSREEKAKKIKKEKKQKAKEKKKAEKVKEREQAKIKGKGPVKKDQEEKVKQDEKNEDDVVEDEDEEKDEADEEENDDEEILESDEDLEDDPALNIFQALEDDAAADQEGADVSAWADLDLSQDTLSALSKLGFANPTLIQSEAIPEILAGHDVVGKASTGSGKTLAFGIPIIESWLETYGELDEDEMKELRPPTALILSPTRELAHQITEHLTALCKGLPNAPWVAAVTGGLSVQKQQRQLAKADIIVGTPGRLWETMSSSIELSASFRQLKFLVVDEADRLLTEGHFKEAEEIIGALDRQVDPDEEEPTLVPRQTLVFSATFHKGLQQKLSGKKKGGASLDSNESVEYLIQKLNFREDKPKFIDVNPISQMADKLKEGMVECSGLEKDLYLYALLMYHPNQRTLIFTNSIHSVRRITPLLQNLGLSAHALHSQMAQKARMRSIERFSAPKATGGILVATDVAARGLDIGGVQLVIHYHLPRAADMYVHRSGRTARAEASGTSILMCAPEEVVGMRRLVAKVHAQNAADGGGKKSKYYIRSLDIDRKVVARIKPRVTLAKAIADSLLAKEKKGHDDDWIKNAAEELGVDYDSEEFQAAGGERKGRGTGRKLKEKASRNMSKGDINELRGELNSLLSDRVNVGVSVKYLTSGTVDINELLKGTQGEFLGKVDGIGMEE